MELIGTKNYDTPMELNTNLHLEDGEPAQFKGSYQRLIDKLIYLIATTPYITNIMNRLLKYLHGTHGKGILFKRSGNMSIKGYVDTNCAGDINDTKYTKSYYCFIGSNLVS